MTDEPFPVTTRVRTDLKIVPFGDDLMVMFNNDGDELVTATRDAGGWAVAGSGPDETAPDRSAAIDAMNQRALATLGEAGVAHGVQVPVGLRQAP